jgi:hypothetical protein
MICIEECSSCTPTLKKGTTWGQGGQGGQRGDEELIPFPFPFHGRCYNGGENTPVASTEGTSAQRWLRNALPPLSPLPFPPQQNCPIPNFQTLINLIAISTFRKMSP